MPDILQGLLARKEKIAKMPEDAQRKIWGFAFAQSVAPRLREAATRGAKLEDENVSKERFITSMLGKAQTPSAEPAVAKPGFIDDTQAFLASIGSGLATRVRSMADLGVTGMPTGAVGAVEPKHSDWTPNQPVGDKYLQKAENLFNENVQTSPIASNVGAAVGHAIPELAAYEAGVSTVKGAASLIPATRAVQVGSETIKAAPWIRAAQKITEQAGGLAAMSRMRGEDVTPGKLTAEAVGFSIIDMITHGAFRSGAAGVAKARSMFGTIRTATADASGKVTPSAVKTFDNAFLDLLKRENPQAYERIVKGEDANKVLSVEQQVDLTNKVSTAQAQARIVTEQNAKTTKQAEKESASAAKGLEKIRTQAQAALDRKAQALKNKALQREVSAYAKATGKVPAEGSEAMKALQNGAKASEILTAEKASVLQRVSTAKDVNANIAMVEEQPALSGMVEDLQALAPKPATAEELNVAAKEREKGLLAKAEEHRIATEAQRAALPGGVRTEVTKKVSAVKQKIAASTTGARAYHSFGITLDTSTWTTPEAVITAKKSATDMLIAEGKKRSEAIIEGINNGSLNKAQADAAKATLASDILTAAKSIEKEKAPGVGREARDRLRNRANVAEGRRVLGEKQKAAEKSGGAVGSEKQMTEQEAIDEIDTLVKIGFGSASRSKIAKDIIASADAEGMDNLSKLELLQQAYSELKKAGK